MLRYLFVARNEGAGYLKVLTIILFSWFLVQLLGDRTILAT